MYDVIALGELLVDLAERTKDENGYPTLAANPGGAPGNFLAALSAYGKKTAFLAKVGDDTFGHLLTGTMRRAGIDTRGILISPDTFTTLAFVTFDAHGDRSFAFARKPGADTQLRWEEIDPAMLEQARVFHFGSLSCTDEPARTATQKAAAYARAHGKLVTYDPNYRAPLWKTEQEAKAQILWGLSQADIVKISDEETQFLWGCGPEEGAERVLALGARLVMVTLGPKGCLLKNAQAEFSCGFCTDAQGAQTIGKAFREKNYLLDTHTAVACTVLDAYRAETSDQTLTVVESTASPFKFCASVLDALGVTEHAPGTGVLGQLTAKTGRPAPKPLASLAGKAVRFDQVTDKAAMRTVVTEFLR